MSRACATGCHAGLRDDDKGMICGQCRADLELGRLVRAMPVGSGLFRESSSWAYDRDVINGSDEACGETPEEALKALKGE